MDVTDRLDTLQAFPVLEPKNLVPRQIVLLDKRFLNVLGDGGSGFVRDVSYGRVHVREDPDLGPDT